MSIGSRNILVKHLPKHSFVASNFKITQRLSLYGLTLICFFTAFAFVVFGQNTKSKNVSIKQTNKKDSNYLDKTKTAILTFNKTKYKGYPFDTTYNSVSLTNYDIKIIDSLLLVAIAKYNNNEYKQNVYMKIDLTKTVYRKQLVAAKDKFGHRFVWVNNFCDFMKEYWKPIWKKQIISTADGGHCYFQFKINLDTNEIFNFYVNGYG